MQYRAYQKLNSTYVEGLLKVIGEDGRIHSTFNQTEARTGRLSSDNPNLQNIPIRTELGSQLRAYFVAKPGCVLVDADYSQIELRILAPRHRGRTHAARPSCTGEDIHRMHRRQDLRHPPERGDRPGCAPLPRPSTSASCTARAPTACPRTSA